MEKALEYGGWPRRRWRHSRSAQTGPGVSLFIGRSWVLLSQVTDFMTPRQKSSVELPTSSAGSEKSWSPAANSPPEDRQSDHHACGVVERRGTQLVEYVNVAEALRLDHALEVVRLKGGPEGGVGLVLAVRLGIGRADLCTDQPNLVVECNDLGAFGRGVDLATARHLGDIGRCRVGEVTSRRLRFAEPARRTGGERRPGRSQRKPPPIERNGWDARQPLRRRFACPDRMITRHSAAAVPARPCRARRSGRDGTGCDVGVPNGTRTRVSTLKGWCPDL